MKKKNLVMMLLCGIICSALMGCSNSQNGSATENTVSDTVVKEENYETGDASLDNTRNQDEIGDNELLVISFGTSYNDNRRATIGAIEQSLEDAFSEQYDVRRAFTSQIIIDHVKERDQIVIDNVEDALQRAIDNGVKNLIVQPTHLMNGLEYQDVEKEVAKFSDAFEKVAIGTPLLTSDEDFQTVMETIVEDTSVYDDGETAICFMGHGTEADSNIVYTKLQELLTSKGYEHYYIGTVEAAPTLEDLLAAVKNGKYKKVVLQPLMIVAGDHANNDMAGETDSWESAFKAEGYEVKSILRGLGEMPKIQALFAEHAQKAIDSITNTDKVATAEEMVASAQVEEDGMEPVYADALKEGTYQITVDSSSSMFSIVNCKLLVEQGQMKAVMTMKGKGYLYLFMGTGIEAANADENQYIPFQENEDGVHTFTIPVEALDQAIPCAAYSKKKEKWYDRDLLFRVDSLSQDAFADGIITVPEMQDGEYTIEAQLNGGSGKTTVMNPVSLLVKNGNITATVELSSKNYDYMIVDGEKYLPVNGDGNSTFEIPVCALDYKMPISADTIAMSTPHEIEYTLYFDSTTLKEK